MDNIFQYGGYNDPYTFINLTNPIFIALIFGLIVILHLLLSFYIYIDATNYLIPRIRRIYSVFTALTGIFGFLLYLYNKTKVRRTKPSLIRIDNIHKIEENLSISQIRLLNILFEKEDQIKTDNDLFGLHNRSYSSPKAFKSNLNQLYSLGLIHDINGNIQIPDEIKIWFMEFRKKKILDI